MTTKQDKSLGENPPEPVETHVGPPLAPPAEHDAHVLALLNHGLGLIEACEKHLGQCVDTTGSGNMYCLVCRRIYPRHELGCTVARLRDEVAKAKGSHHCPEDQSLARET